MQTRILASLRDDPLVEEADSILRNCVHCGFCTATCPTYQLTGDELDGPRGRIYLINQMLETGEMTDMAQNHLDRCLTCRSCETTCPSGVRYGRLLDISRGMLARRSFIGELNWREWTSLSWSRLWRRIVGTGLRTIIPRDWLFRPALRTGQVVREWLPAQLKAQVPAPNETHYTAKVVTQPVKRVLVLGGCVQKAATPQVNEALSYLLSLHNIATEFLVEESCCGALDYHLSAHDAGMARMRTLVRQIRPRLDSIDAIISTASGCGVTIKDYPEIFAHEADLQEVAEVASKVVDASEFLQGLLFQAAPVKVAVQVPCSLQHGQQLPHGVEAILRAAGIEVLIPQDAHLCCGSAGTYSLLQPAMSAQLKKRKLEALLALQPDVIASANIGCQLHLGADSPVAVRHWLEILADQVASFVVEPPQ
ncbi:MAG: glycolate oxidase subunit GlcF [Pseudomonadales bacterium]|nr:glycolate oxidase subunit GlcF [Pseudomonadales bacterium]